MRHFKAISILVILFIGSTSNADRAVPTGMVDYARSLSNEVTNANVQLTADIMRRKAYLEKKCETPPTAEDCQRVAEDLALAEAQLAANAQSLEGVAETYQQSAGSDAPALNNRQVAGVMDSSHDFCDYVVYTKNLDGSPGRETGTCTRRNAAEVLKLTPGGQSIVLTPRPGKK